MAQRLPIPFPTFVDSAGAPYAGGTLNFYLTDSGTPLAVYSDATLSTAIGTSVLLNSAGRPSTAIFLQNRPYKVVLKDSSGNEIWTADPVSASDFASFSIRKVGSGSPNGVVEGVAASPGVLPTEFWDFTNFMHDDGICGDGSVDCGQRRCRNRCRRSASRLPVQSCHERNPPSRRVSTDHGLLSQLLWQSGSNL